MGQFQPLVFSDISPEQFEKLTAKAQSVGIDISGNCGSAIKSGVEVAWDYLPESQKLTLQCLHAPFFVKPDEINTRIQALVKESLADEVQARS